MPHYTASLDRAGFALLAGGALGGMFASVLAGVETGPAPLPILVAFLGGTIVTAALAVAIGGPVWWVCHARGWRGPGVATGIGALAGFALFAGAQTYGFGLLAMPPSDAQTLLFRWISALATSVPLACVTALIGWTMWRVAYRRS